MASPPRTSSKKTKPAATAAAKKPKAVVALSAVRVPVTARKSTPAKAAEAYLRGAAEAELQALRAVAEAEIDLHASRQILAEARLDYRDALREVRIARAEQAAEARKKRPRAGSRGRATR